MYETVTLPTSAAAPPPFPLFCPKTTSPPPLSTRFHSPHKIGHCTPTPAPTHKYYENPAPLPTCTVVVGILGRYFYIPPIPEKEKRKSSCLNSRLRMEEREEEEEDVFLLHTL